MLRRRPPEYDDWDLHKNSMRSLIVHALLQAVRDAEKLTPEQTESEMTPTAFSSWLDSMRFEFWVEWIDMPVEVAEVTLASIASGTKDVSSITKTASGRRRAPHEVRRRG